MSDTPYRIELIVYPDRTIEFKGDAFEIESAKRILLSSSQALARREGIEEAMRVVEEAKSGIEYDDGSLSKFGHTITDLILESLQEKLDTKGV